MKWAAGASVGQLKDQDAYLKMSLQNLSPPCRWFPAYWIIPIDTLWVLWLSSFPEAGSHWKILSRGVSWLTQALTVFHSSREESGDGRAPAGRSEEAGRQPCSFSDFILHCCALVSGLLPLHSWFLKPPQASPQVFWPSSSLCLQDFPEAATEDHTFCRHPLLFETFPDHIVYIVPTQARPSLPSPVFISPLHLTADRHCVHLPIGPEWGLHEGRPHLLSADPLILYLCLAHSQVSHGCFQGRIGLLTLKHIVTPLESTFLSSVCWQCD